MGLSDTIENAAYQIKNITEAAENTWKERRLKYKVWYVVPTSRLAEFEMTAMRMNISYRVDQIFYPHLTTEVMPDLSSSVFDKCRDYNSGTDCQATVSVLTLDLALQYFSHIIHQLGLAVVKINK